MVSDATIQALATRLQVEAATLRAIIAVESTGSGLVNGRPLIRVEAHKLWDNTSGAAREAINGRFHVGGPKRWENHTWLDGSVWRKMHVGQNDEWRAYDVAFAIDSDAAVRSTSWGMGQVIGEWPRLRYASRDAFVAAQATLEGQADTMARFIEADSACLAAARTKNWRKLAACYNGVANVDEYAPKLAAAYRA